ncbi:hypothetical protein ACP70R_031965 [Stipagrostis hirtigluma subsp. patula]
MMYGKVAVLLFLVCAIVSNHQVNGVCTFAQKKSILRYCKTYLIVQHPVVPPSYMRQCCKSVKKVPNMDMECILGLCTNKEKKTILEDNLLKLKDHCSLDDLPPPPSPPSHQQMM